jgi:hypothetical protein
MMDNKEICKNNEIEYINEVRNFRKSNINGQKKKINTIPPKNIEKHIESLSKDRPIREILPRRKNMKKYFLIKRLNPRKKRQKVQEDNSDDKYFS